MFDVDDQLDASTKRLVRDMAGKYQMWHRKPVRAWKERKFDFPARVGRVGRAVSIVYESDKWEKDGALFNYVHDFSSGPVVYRAGGKSAAARDTRGLLGVSDLKGLIPLVQLATVVEVIVDNGKKRWPLAFSNQPPLMTTLDTKTLVILCRDPIFISGGEMRVRAPGIVK